MFPLFETIRVAAGTPRHLAYHTARLNRSRRELFGSTDVIDLAGVIEGKIDDIFAVEYRCRVTYGREIGEISFAAYVRKTIGSLALVDGGGLGYAHKYVDRSGIEERLAGCGADDILIVREGLVTDASIANVAFFDGSHWLTPASPLLPGTTRARLIDEGRVQPADIRASEIGRFSTVALMNSMVGFDLEHPIPVQTIIPL